MGSLTVCVVRYGVAKWLIIIRLCIYLVVIHDGVERLNPHWVNISIQNNPLGVVTGEVSHVSHQDGVQPCRQ